MRLMELTCTGFRCLRHLSWSPLPGLNVIRGLNAQGKTTILEALLFAATSKSHRTNTESDLLREGDDRFYIKAAVERLDRSVTLEAMWLGGAKRFRVNGVPQARISDILGKIHLVFFSPEDVALVRGAAAVRRTFMDMELSQLSPAYLRALQQYRLVMRHRNQLLRADRWDENQLDVWDAQLAEHGERLMRDRSQFVQELSVFASRSYQLLSGAEDMSMIYKPCVRQPGSLASVLAGCRANDIKQKVTTQGPHRDDIDLFIAGRNARHFASQGQQRTAALAIKLAEVDLVHQRIGEFPILMLDDVLGELDVNRSNRLVQALDRGIQCLLTTTNLTDSARIFGSRCGEFEVSAGEFVRHGGEK
ncbi:MAG: DNA replication and repair protein RecF [Candidatus Hydrogenedentota bacterium]